jgi:Protein of unknown function (DUF402)
MWQPGDTALLRNIARGKVWNALATRVVRDMEDLVVLYWAPGYLFKSSASNRETARVIWFEDLPFSHVDRVWEDLEVLALMKPDAGHATWLVRRDGEFLGWYVNLQRPIVRTALGFDTPDLALDIIIRPDLVTYRWKDEDELAEDVERRFITPEEAKAIRAEGERVIENARERGPPFGDGWEAWRPESSWVTPRIPEGWDRV